MSIEKYWPQLSEIEKKFCTYKQNLESIIHSVAASTHHTVITKGEIANPTPYYYERMGTKLAGKVLQVPVASENCLRYHYDSENRIIMVEEGSKFLKCFRIKEIYLHNEHTERLVLSSDYLAVLAVFDNAFSNTQLSLAFAGSNGHIVEEFVYTDSLLTEIKISRDYSPYDQNISRYNNRIEWHRFIYENQSLIQIERICDNGYKELMYTTKKPDFNKIKEDTYHKLRELIANNKRDFASFGIEGFLDQQQPMLVVCFSEDKHPSELIADWNTDMHDIWVYDWQFNDSQERKCVKIIAEIVVELIGAGLLKDKQIYFHQNQVCVTQMYSGAKSVFKKANISVQ